MASAETAPLSPFYYRDNFLRLCDTVEARYGDLLNGTETGFLATFRALSSPAQCLYVRLVTRVGPWFRESRLRYEELGDVGPLLDELLAAQMACEAHTVCAQDLGRLFTARELRAAFAARLDTAPPGKGALLAALDAIGLQPRELLTTLGGVDDQRLVAPVGADIVALLQLLFFGNRRQSLTEFVLEDLGVVRYYPYNLDRTLRLFACREALEEYLALAALGDRRVDLLETDDAGALVALADEVLACRVRHVSSQSRWQRLCNALGRDVERLQAWDTALALYRRSGAHPGRERCARILEKTGDLHAAARLCQEIREAPWCEAEAEAAERILPRLRRALDVTPGTRRRDRFDRLDLALPRGDSPVELLVARHLQPQWQSVHYVENALPNALFGLAFWEQIFQPAAGAFHHPFQAAPADMYHPGFMTRRAASIDRRLAELGERDLPGELAAACRRYRGYQCRWVDWRRISDELVAEAARLIPSRHLLAIWRRMLFDPAENRRGFPDLVAFGERSGEYCLIEVKGPGDALQCGQKRWLRFFASAGIPARVAWVEWRNGP